MPVLMVPMKAVIRVVLVLALGQDRASVFGVLAKRTSGSAWVCFANAGGGGDGEANGSSAIRGSVRAELGVNTDVLALEMGGTF